MKLYYRPTLRRKSFAELKKNLQSDLGFGSLDQDPPKETYSPVKEDTFGRSYYYCDKLDEYGNSQKDYKEVSFPQDANLISSKLANGKHAPTLDIDLPCKLWESSTPGHHHLTIDCEMDWEQYEMLLIVLGECGILEPNYVAHSLKQGSTFLRRPGVKKETTSKSADYGWY